MLSFVTVRLLVEYLPSVQHFLLGIQSSTFNTESNTINNFINALYKKFKVINFFQQNGVVTSRATGQKVHLLMSERTQGTPKNDVCTR